MEGKYTLSKDNLPILCTIKSLTSLWKLWIYSQQQLYESTGSFKAA